MPDDFAMDSHVSSAPEADLPETWREHVRELRGENARRRKENQELRAQLAALTERLAEAEAAQTEASERSSRDAARLSTVHRRLKEVEVARLSREALRAAAARREGGAGATAGSPSRVGAPLSTAGQASSGTPGQGRAVVDMARAQRLLERLPAPIDLDADLVVDDEGHVALEDAAGGRLTSFVEEVVDLLAVEQRVAPPPVGGEPPRPAEGAAGPMANSWDPDGQRTPAGKVRAALRKTVASNATVLDGLAQL